jgi:N6-adenosine-specific RNA methylase IME4
MTLSLVPPPAATPPYVTVLADPAWPFSDKLTMEPVKRGAAAHYPTMSVSEIGALYTPSSVTGPMFGSIYTPATLAGIPIADAGFLWLWTTATHLLSGDAAWVMRQWGYQPKQIVPWVKGRCIDSGLVLNVGMGRITRGVSEFLLVGTRGTYTPLVKVKNENGLILDWGEDVILAPRQEHSRKPKEQYAKVERVCPGPYLELFARERREGWTSVGHALGVEMTAAGTKELIEPDPGLDWSF